MDGDVACEMLRRVLTLNDADWGTPATLEVGGYVPDLTNQLLNIYSKVCPQVTASVPPAIASLVHYYIEEVAKKLPTTPPTPATPPTKEEIKYNLFQDKKKKAEWEALKEALKPCEAKADKLPLYRTKVSLGHTHSLKLQISGIIWVQDWANHRKKRELEAKLKAFALNPESSGYTRKQVSGCGQGWGPS